MSATSLMYWDEKLGKAVPRSLLLTYNITAAKTVSPVPQNSIALVTFDALSTQSQIDDQLGTTNEFLLAAFDATAMGADAFGGVVAMGGQVKDLVAMVARCYSGTAGATLVERQVGKSSALTSSSLTTEVAVGSSGNIGFRVDFGNTPDFDALTAGYIMIELLWIAK